jgi:hypothetical protein
MGVRFLSSVQTGYVGEVGHEGGASENVALAIKNDSSVLSRARSISLFSLSLFISLSLSANQ